MGALEEIRGRLQKSGDQSQWYDVHEMSEALEFAGVDTSTIKDDAEFIAHAPEDMARLLADVQNVLNLHAPRTEGSDEPYCRHCYAPPYGHAPYPCPTVQCITAALEAKP